MSKKEAGRVLMELDVKKVIPTPDNPRVIVDDQEMDDLVSSILAHGVLQPVVVRKHPTKRGKYDLRAGHRRHHAAKRAKLKAIPAMVLELDDTAALEVTICENLHRSDLSPIEESRGINTLLAAGWDVHAAADKLGKSPGWVARRASLANLSEVWQKALLDPESGVFYWPAGHLEYIARFPEHVQDDACGELLNWSTPTLSDLHRFIKHRTQTLSAAVWDVAADGIAAEGACSKCMQRTDAQPLLFEDMRDDKKGAQCLDGQCWEQKELAWLRARIAELQKEHGGELILIENYNQLYREEIPGQRFSHYDVTKCKKSAAGATPSLILMRGDDFGKLLWRKPDKGAAGSSRATSTSGKKTMKQKRAMLDGRRNTWIVGEVVEALQEADCPDDATLLRFCLAFGTQDHWSYAGSTQGGWLLFRTLGQFPSPPGEPRNKFWTDQIVPVLLNRLKVYKVSDCTLAEATPVAAYLGLDLDALTKQAVVELPDPKSWKKEKK